MKRKLLTSQLLGTAATDNDGSRDSRTSRADWTSQLQFGDFLHGSTVDPGLPARSLLWGSMIDSGEVDRRSVGVMAVVSYRRTTRPP